MSDGNLEKIEKLFQSAADLPRGERDAFLDRECAGKPDMRHEIEQLLAQLDRNETLESPAASWASAPLSAGPGTVIGRYELKEKLGEGGFGVVYLAEQTEPVRRQVALKIIKLGMDTMEVVARFEAERQALALMDHPNIAKVLDGGATEAGRPFFVMELVHGISLTEYCDEHSLTMRQRLELFVQVCHAVQHAHQKGVIHRDLKPNNVLVALHDGVPVPKVIDFGVAKAMHARLTEKTLHTADDRFIGTPAYMSPEQADMTALDVDTRSDIYSLGVLLYELLTGTTPLKPVLRGGLAEVQRLLREEQPPRPSIRISRGGDTAAAERRRLDVDSLTRRLRGDLDWIVMKALEKDRTRRYESASELAADLTRHLGNEPVLAGQPSRAYRLHKFLQRHRAAVFSASLITLALVAGIFGTSSAMLEASRQRDEALAARARVEQEAERTQSVTEFLIETLALTDPGVALDADLSVATLLDKASTEVGTVFRDQPEAEARLRSTLGKAYKALGQNELAEFHLRRAVELGNAIDNYDQALHYATYWDLTHALFNLERPESMTVAQEARRVAHDHIRSSHPELAATLDRFIETINAAGFSRQAGAAELLPAAFDETVRQTDAALPQGHALWPIVADTWVAAGYSLWYGPHEPLTAAFFRRAYEIQERELPLNHPTTGDTMGLLVGVLNRVGKAAEAEAAIRATVERMRGVLQPASPQLATLESMLAVSLFRQGRFEEAEPLMISSHGTIRHVSDGKMTFLVADSFSRVLEMYEAWDQPDKAKPYRDDLRQHCAGGYMLQPWPILRLTFGPEHEALRTELDALDVATGGVAWTARQEGIAVDDLDQRIDRILRLSQELPNTHPLSIIVGRQLNGLVAGLAGDDSAAVRRRLIQAVLPQIEPTSEPYAQELAEAYAQLAAIEASTGSVAAGRRHGQRAAAVMGDVHNDSVYMANVRVRVARNLVVAGLYPEAEVLLKPAHGILLANFGPANPDVSAARQLLNGLYESWGKPDQASAYADPT